MHVRGRTRTTPHEWVVDEISDDQTLVQCIPRDAPTWAHACPRALRSDAEAGPVYRNSRTTVTCMPSRCMPSILSVQFATAGVVLAPL
jgi:hypothetical protein